MAVEGRCAGRPAPYPTSAELVEEAGGRSATLAEAHLQLDSTRRSLESVPLAPAALGEILALLPFLVDRTR